MHKKEANNLKVFFAWLTIIGLVAIYLYLNSIQVPETVEVSSNLTTKFLNPIYTLILAIIPSILAVLISFCLYHKYITKTGLIKENLENLENLENRGCKYEGNPVTINFSVPKNLKELEDIFHYYVHDKHNSLDYIAYIDTKQKDSIVEVIPRFSERLKKFKIEKSRDQQIALYEKFSTSIHGMLTEVNLKFQELGQGVLFSVIYDVKKGGIFYYHIKDGAYIFIASLDQASMDDGTAEIEVKSIVSKVKEVI